MRKPRRFSGSCIEVPGRAAVSDGGAFGKRRHLESERAAATGCTAQQDERPAQLLGQSARERESESCAAVGSCNRGISLLERFEEVAVPFWCNTDSGIGHVDDPSLGAVRLRGVQRNNDASAFVKLHGIGDQVDQHLAQPVAIGADAAAAAQRFPQPPPPDFPVHPPAPGAHRGGSARSTGRFRSGRFELSGSQSSRRFRREAIAPITRSLAFHRARDKLKAGR